MAIVNEGTGFGGLRTATDRITTLLLGVVALVFAIAAVFAHDRITATLAVLAASCTGAVLGLLFAIPKRVAVPDDAASETGGNRSRGAVLVANTSLEEVSDWLTKTIIGVGLVSWGTVLDRLDQAGAYVGLAMTGQQATALACGVALIVAAAASGGLCAYLWFSRHLPKEFIDAFPSRSAAQGLAQQGDAVAPLAPTTAALAGDEPAGNPDADDPAQHLQQAVSEHYARMREAPLDVDDWARGLFGGKASVTNAHGQRRIDASIKSHGSGVYEVALTVSAEPPPATPCVFFLHNTFPNTTPAVSFDAAGQATLRVSAWGAFTVGALTDDGTTELELNLATVPGAPRGFRTA